MKKVTIVDITGTIILAATIAAIIFLFVFKSNGNYITNILIG